MTPALRAACARAMHVLTRDGQLLRSGRATLFILEGLGFERSARVARFPPLVWLVELGYWLVARNRSLLGRLLSRATRDRS